MSTVYLALGNVDYEGDTVVGVYATRDEAIERCQTIAVNADRASDFAYHSYEVAAWEVGGYMPDRSQEWSWRPDRA